MAIRPVFVVREKSPYVEKEDVEFNFFPGFSEEQKRKSIGSLHDSWIKYNANKRVLEVSTKSKEEIGRKLSAFNLISSYDGNRPIVLENDFQSSKVFRDGGPFEDLRLLSPREAKKDPRLSTSGPLIEFINDGIVFPLIPTSFFYDWLYVNAVYNNRNLLSKASEYDAFTDIEFNPNRSINCQAHSLAIAVGLFKSGKIEKALSSPMCFKEYVYLENKCIQGELALF